MSLLSRPLRMGGLPGHADIVRISAQLTESPSIAGSFFTGRVASTGRHITQPNDSIPLDPGRSRPIPADPGRSRPIPADDGGTATREVIPVQECRGYREDYL